MLAHWLLQLVCLVWGLAAAMSERGRRMHLRPQTEAIPIVRPEHTVMSGYPSPHAVVFERGLIHSGTFVLGWGRRYFHGGAQLHCFGSGGLAILFSPLRAGYSSAAALCSFQGPHLMTPGPLWVRGPSTAQSRLMPSQHASILPLHTSRPQLYLHCEAFGRCCLPRPRFAFGTWVGNSVIQAYVEDLPAIVPKACQLTSRYIFALVRCLGGMQPPCRLLASPACHMC